MLQHYLTTALRHFRRHKLTTAINVFGLALGLACFIAAYSALAYLRSGDRHFSNADRIYAIAQRQSGQGDLDTGMRPLTAPVLAKYIRADFPELEAVVRATRLQPIAAAVDGRAALVAAAAAEADFLRMFDLEFTAGGGADALRSPRSAVLTRDAAVRLLGTHDAVGRTLLLSNAVEVTVTGVIEELQQPSHMGSSAVSAFGFEMLLSWGVYRELSQLRSGRDPDSIPEFEAWGWAGYLTYVMLPGDGSLSAATFNERLRSFSALHVPPERARTQKYEFRAVSLPELWIAAVDGGRLGGRGMSAVSLLTLLSGLILFTACVNYANLATAQAATRAREIGLRKVTGARSFGVGVQFMLEAALSAASALLIALLLVIALAPMLRSISGIDLIQPLQHEIGLWGLIAAVLLLVVFVAGSYPATVLSRLRPAQVISGGRVAGTPAFVPTLLVGIQFGAASLLLIAVIVVYAQHREMRERALGEGADPVVAIHGNLQASNVRFDTLRNELLRSPHIKSVAAIDAQPWSSVNTFALTRTQDPAEQLVSPLLYAVTSDFFSTFDVRLLAGRTFDVRRSDDVFPGAMPGAMAALGGERTFGVVIDRRLAVQLGWSDPRDAVGQRIYMPLSRIGRTDQALRVVGVVEHKPLSLTTPDANANMFYFLPDAAGFREVLVGISRENVDEALTDIDAAWRKLSPNIPVARQFVDEVFEQHYATFSRMNVMIAALAALALVISVLGLFGMALFVAARRRHEIGVRKTLGASTTKIVALLLRDFSKPVVVANVIAWPVAWFAARSYLSVFVYRIDLTLTPFLCSLVVALLVAWIAVAGNTVRAARVSPAAVLRYG